MKQHNPMIEHLKSLLRTHDCVVMPGLGGLIAHYEPARINEPSGTMAPPTKRLAFNRALQQDDGLLVSFVSLQEAISYEDAGKKVSHFCSHVQRQLKSAGTFMLPGLGRFVMSASGDTIQFKPVLKENLLLSSYLLPLVIAERVERVEEVLEEAPLSAVPSAADPAVRELQLPAAAEVPIPEYRPWIFRAAAVVGMCFLLTTALVGIRKGDLGDQRLSVLPAPVLSLPMAMPSLTSLSKSMPDLSGIKVYEDDAVSRETPVTAPADGAELNIPVGTIFHVIVGSFLDDGRLERATNRMNALGYATETLEGPNGYVRLGIVFNSAALTRNDALQLIRETVNGDAWIPG